MLATDRDTSHVLMRPALKKEVSGHVRDLIFTGALRPGERLDLDELARRFVVSRFPIREAMILLEAEGLVSTMVRRGSYVSELQDVDIIDHFAMFGAIGGIAAARLAASPSAEVTRELRRLSQAMQVSSDAAEQDTLNFQFHRLINRGGGSRRLLLEARRLSESMPSHFFGIGAEWDFQEQAFDEHNAIVDALERGDAQTVSDLLVVHFRHTGEQAVRYLRSLGFWGPVDEQS